LSPCRAGRFMGGAFPRPVAWAEEGRAVDSDGKQLRIHSHLFCEFVVADKSWAIAGST